MSKVVGKKKREILWSWAMLIAILVVIAYVDYDMRTTQKAHAQAFNAEIEALSSKIEDLNKQLSELEYEYNKLKEENTALKAENEKLRLEVTSLNQRQEAYELGLMQLTQNAEILTQNVSNISNNLTKIVSNVSNINKKLNSLRLDLMKTYSKVTQIENKYIPPLNPMEVLNNSNAVSVWSTIELEYFGHRDEKEVSFEKILKMHPSFKKAIIEPSDLIHIVPAKEDLGKIQKFVEWSRISQKPYIWDYYDCDNFAWALYGKFKDYFPSLSVGVAVTKDHAFNVIVFYDNAEGDFEIYVIEPQTGEIMSIEEAVRDEAYDNVKYVFI